MVSSLFASALVAAGAFHLVDAANKICSAAGCDDCPVSTTDSGTGWPSCTIYNSADVFTGIFEQNNETGTWDVWFDVPEQTNTECYWLIKSPASLGIDTCGETMWYGSGGSCRSLSIRDTFMLQFCCGTGDCCSAGIANLPGCGNDSKLKKKRDMMSRPIFSMRSNDGNGQIEARGTGSGSLTLVGRDGKVIQPAEQGIAPEYRRDVTLKAKVESLKPRGACGSDSWVDDGSEYITTSPYTQVVSDTQDGGTEGTTIQISKERTASWSTTIEANVGFADIFSMGLSFSIEESESISTTKGAEYTIPAGQKGYVAWTAFVYCKKGSGECNDSTVSGTVCIPYKSGGEPAGEFHLVQAG